MALNKMIWLMNTFKKVVCLSVCSLMCVHACLSRWAFVFASIVFSWTLIDPQCGVCLCVCVCWSGVVCLFGLLFGLRLS